MASNGGRFYTFGKNVLQTVVAYCIYRQNNTTCSMQWDQLREDTMNQ